MNTATVVLYPSLVLIVTIFWISTSSVSSQSPGTNVSSISTPRTISFLEEQPAGTPVARLSELLLPDLLMRAPLSSPLPSRTTASPTRAARWAGGGGGGSGPGTPGSIPGPSPSHPNPTHLTFTDAELAKHVMLVRPTQYLALDTAGVLRTAARVDREALCSQGVRTCCCPAPGTGNGLQLVADAEERTGGGPERTRESAISSRADALTKGAVYESIYVNQYFYLVESIK